MPIRLGEDVFTNKKISEKNTARLVDAMKASGPADLLRYDLHPGVSHSYLGRVFYMSEPYEWLFKHSLSDSVRTVDQTIQITKDGMSKAYKSMPGRRTLKVVEYKGKK